MRGVLVKHNVDLGLVTARVYPRKIIVRGHLKRLFGSGEELDATAVRNIMEDLEAIPEIRQVHCDLGNWTYCSASRGWEMIRTEEEILAATAARKGLLSAAPAGRPAPRLYP